MNNIQLIWNILCWIDFFGGLVKIVPILYFEGEYIVTLENGDYSVAFNLAKEEDLLAIDCALTWWANMGHNNHANQDGENIWDFDLTKDDNRLIYGRYRHGFLAVRIGEPDNLEEDAAVCGREIFREKIGENFDGYIDIEQFKLETEELIDWSEAFDQHSVDRDAFIAKCKSCLIPSTNS